MENNRFKRINPFRKLDPFDTHLTASDTEQSKKDHETKPKLFSPPDVGATEVDEQKEIDEDSRVNRKNKVTSFANEFTSMLNNHSLSNSEYKGTQENQEQKITQDSSYEQVEEDSIQDDEWRKERNPFKGDFVSILEESVDQSSKEDKYHSTEYTDSDEEDSKQVSSNESNNKHSFVEEFTKMLDLDEHGNNEAEETDKELSDNSTDDSNEKQDIDGLLEGKEQLHDSNEFTKEFTTELESEHAKEWQERNNKVDYTNHLEDSNEDGVLFPYFEDDQEDLSEDEFIPDMNFIKILEENYGKAEDVSECVSPYVGEQLEDNSNEEEVHQGSDKDEFSGYDDFDHVDEIQQEMISMLEANDGDESSIQFMEDVIEYFDEMEGHHSFPLDRFLQLLMSIYCSEEQIGCLDYRGDNSGKIDHKQNEHCHCEKNPSVIAKLPATLAYVNLDLDFFDTIELYSQITKVQNINWSVTSLKSIARLPSNIIFFRGVIHLEIEYESNGSFYTMKIPLKWNKNVDVSWVVPPELAEEYEEEYTFEANELSTHQQTYQKPAPPIFHDLQGVNGTWQYDLDSSTQTNVLQLNGSVTLSINLFQPQYLTL